jgi:signal transduction histidine kinase
MKLAQRLTVGLRGRLLLTGLVAIAAALVGLTLAFNLVLADRLDRDATGVVQARASAEIAALRISAGRIVLPEAPDELSPDLQIWVFQGRRALELPRTAAATNAAAAALARRAPGFDDVSGTRVRLYSVPVVQAGRRLGAVVAGVSLVPYQQTRRTALVASAVLALAVLAAFGLAAHWLIAGALRPVARMTRQASEWSEHDLDRRFGLGPARDELTQLGDTLDDLLDRLAASLRHEQRLSAEISHELRTPLASIVAEAQYALRHGELSDEGRATLEHILQSARGLGRTLDTLMAAARAQLDPGRATSDVVAWTNAAIRASVDHNADRGLDVQVAVPQHPIRAAVEANLGERILVPLLDNAVRHARGSILISVERDGDDVRLTIQDDGPGVPAGERETIFQPGHRIPASGATATVGGAGLGLSLCRRLARTAGGDVQAEPSDAGARFVVRLPAA